jgi:DNA processing protein
VRGALPSLARAVAIVGTRRPDAAGARFAHRLGAELAEAGWVIVSGGALGIDTEAHLGALEVGGPTVAVLATGLSRLYPAANRPLFARIAASGALLSEHDDLGTVHKGDFLARNRLVAAIARVVIVVQAPIRSGALSTAAHARRLGRTLFAVPHSPWDPRGEGCLTLLAAGARVCNGSSDVLSLSAPEGEQLPRPNPRRPAKAPNYQELDEDERSVVEALLGGALTADEVCECTQLSAPRAQRAILMLTLSKVIQEVGCGRYARTDCL